MSGRSKDYADGLRKRMGDAHEKYLAKLFGTKVSPGSGNQFGKQMDGRTDAHREQFAFAWDGKSTLGVSISVSKEMWHKAGEQAHFERPMIALRFYATDRLDEASCLDLAVIKTDDLAELIWAANGRIDG